MSSCPSDEELACYVENACAEADAAYIRTHIDRCARCAEWVAGAASNDLILNSVRNLPVTEADDSARDEEPGASGGEGEARSASGRAPQPSLPQAIEGYEILEEIGRGGMGVVYKALQKATKREVAIKVLLEGPFASDASKRRFEREVELAAQLDHPHIVSILESGIATDRYYCAMQYVEGCRLDEHVATAGLSLVDTLRLFAKVCEAVSYAHQRGVIHRDLKPSNILVDSQGNPHILDFGLARMADPDVAAEERLSLLSVTGQVMGTLPYMSPEQARGAARDIDVRSDVYSLGVILYEILTGQYPYAVVGQVADVLRNIAEAEPLRPSTIRRMINDEVETIVLKALSKEPDRRYQGAGELARDVTRYLAGEPIEAKRDSVWYIMKCRIRRHKISVSTVALSVALVIAFGVVTAQAWREGRDKEEETQRSYVARIQLAQLIMPSSSPVIDVKSAREALRDTPEKLRDWEWHYLDAESRPCLREKNVAKHESVIACIAFDRNTGHVAMGHHDGTTRVWDTEAEKELNSTKASGEKPWDITFSPNGDWLAWASDDGAVYLWEWKKPASSGITQIQEMHEASGGAWSVAFDREGKRLAWGEGNGAMRVWDLAARSEIPSLREQHPEHVLCLAFSPDGTRLASGCRDGAVRLWDAIDGKDLPPPFGRPSLEGIHYRPDDVRCIAFDSNGTRLASGTEDGTVRIWDLNTRTVLHEWRDETGSIVSIAFSPDGERLAAGSADRTVRIWDTESGKELTPLRGHTHDVRHVEFTTDNCVVSASSDYTVRFWALPTRQHFAVLGGDAEEICSIAFVPGDIPRLAAGSSDGTVSLWDPVLGERLAVLGQHSLDAFVVASSRDGRRMISVSTNGEMRSWEAFTGNTGSLSVEGLGDVRSIALEPRGEWLAIGNAEGRLYLGRMTDWEQSDISVLRVDNTYKDDDENPLTVKSLAFDPSGEFLVVGTTGYDGDNVYLWDVAARKESRSLAANRGGVECVRFSPDGKTLALVGGGNFRVRLFEMPAGREKKMLSLVTSASSVAFNENGSRLAVCMSNGFVDVWDVERGVRMLTMRPHDAGASSVAFSSDGTQLAAVTENATVHIWDSVPFAQRSETRQEILDAATNANQRVSDLHADLQNWSKVAEQVRRDASLSTADRHAALNEVLRRAAGERKR